LSILSSERAVSGFMQFLNAVLEIVAKLAAIPK
jgi:hypothetical protein